MTLKKLAFSIAICAAVIGGVSAVTLTRAARHEARAQAAFPPEGQILEVNGTALHVVEMGPKDGVPVVLIHGASGNTRDFTQGFAQELAKTYRVLVFDRPGLGYSDPIGPRGGSLAAQAALLQAASAQLGATRPIVLGQSYGGAVALAWAVHHPDNIRALVPVAAASNPWSTGISTYYKLLSHPIAGPVVIPLLTAFVDDARVERELDAIFAPQKPPARYGKHIGAGLTLRRASLRANALQRAAILDEIKALHARYGEIGVPVEILHGTADDTVPIEVHSDKLVTQIPNARLHKLDGIGHMPHHGAQEAVLAAVERAAARSAQHE